MVEQSGEIAGRNPITYTEIATKALRRLRFISPLDSLPLVELFEERSFPVGATVFSHGDLSTSFSVVAAGELTLTVPNEPDGFLLKINACFGEDSVLVPTRHEGEGVVTSGEDLTVLSLEGTIVREFLRGLQPNYPLTEQYRFSDVIRQRTTKEYTPEELEQRKKMLAHLGKVLLFKDFAEDDKKEVVDLLKEQQRPKGYRVFDQGDEGDGLYLLERGEVVAQVKEKEGGGFRDMTTYKGGDYFGEMALLSDQPRSARVLVTFDEGATIFFLPKEDFERFLAGNLNVMRHFVSLMSRRLAETAEVQMPPGN